MTTGRNFADFIGAEVFTSDGDNLGTVKEFRGNYFKVDAAMQPDYWLSASQVQSVDGRRVMLAFTKDYLGDFKMDSPDDRGDRPATDTGYTSTPTTGRSWNDVSTTYRQDFERRYGSSGQRWEDEEPYYRYSYEMRQDPRYRGRRFTEVEPELRTGYSDWARRQGYRADESGWDRYRNSFGETWDRDDEFNTGRTTEGTQRVQLREEELRAQKEAVEVGEVGIRKEVVEEEQTLNVPVRREEVVIERHPVEGRAASGEIREGEEIRIPVREEQVHLGKETVAREEIEIGKQTVEETQQVSGTVRREEAHIEREGDVDVDGDTHVLDDDERRRRAA